MLLRMHNPAVVFLYTEFTVHAAPSSAESTEGASETTPGPRWRGEILNAAGEVEDGFSYTRDRFPGAVIGALRVRDIAFAPKLAARMWVHTDDAE